MIQWPKVIINTPQVEVHVYRAKEAISSNEKDEM